MTGKESDTRDVILRDIPAIAALVPIERIILVPQRRLMERHKGKWKEVLRTCFPGYVFVRAEMDTALYYKLYQIPSVIRILGSNGPQPVPLNEMNAILWLTAEGDTIGISDALHEGEKIKVMAGPLIGLEGQIIKIDARRHRAKVSLGLMGEQRTVELGINLIKSEGESR
jgi:transcriptional antiterminator NusG